MTVVPGAGGKPFQSEGVDNASFSAGQDSIFRGALRGIDGAVNDERIGGMVAKGGQWFVVGSYWFGSEKAGYKSLKGMQDAYNSMMRAADEAEEKTSAAAL